MPVYQIIILIFLHYIKNIMNFPNWLKDPEMSIAKRQLGGPKGPNTHSYQISQMVLG